MSSAEKTYQARARSEFRDQLITEHLPLVRHILGRIGPRLPNAVDQENLEGAGILGLVEAAQHFDPVRGVTFKTFAYRRIRGAIFDELRRNSPFPQTMLRQIARVREVCESLPAPVTIETLIATTGMSQGEVEQTLEAMRLGIAQSWDESNTAGSSLQRTCGELPDQQVEQAELKQLLAHAIEALTEKERLVITLYYLEDLRLKEIGEVLDLSESRISRILAKAEFRVAQWIKAHGG